MSFTWSRPERPPGKRRFVQCSCGNEMFDLRALIGLPHAEIRSPPRFRCAGPKPRCRQVTSHSTSCRVPSRSYQWWHSLRASQSACRRTASAGCLAFGRTKALQHRRFRPCSALDRPPFPHRRRESGRGVGGRPGGNATASGRAGKALRGGEGQAKGQAVGVGKRTEDRPQRRIVRAAAASDRRSGQEVELKKKATLSRVGRGARRLTAVVWKENHLL